MRRKKTVSIVSCVLVLVLLAGLLPGVPNATASGPALSQGQQNIVKRARQMTQIQWTPKKDIIGWGGGLTYRAGVTYTGLPYGQPVNASYVPWSTSLEGFLAAVDNPNSLMYTSYSSYNQRAPYYSIDCSAFVSWAWGLSSRRTTATIPNSATAISTTSYANAQVGDCLNKSNDHVVLITDIDYDDSGNIICIEISESTVVAATNYCCQVVRYGEGGSYSLSYFTSKYFGAGYTLYRSKTRDSVTYTHSCAVPLEGDVCAKCGIGDHETHVVYAQVMADGNVTLYGLPDPSSEILGTIYSGNPIEIAGFTEKNGIVWYKTADGEWIDAAQTAFDRYLHTAELSGRSFPEGNLASGAVFPIRGTVTAVHPIVSLVGYIRTADSVVQQLELSFDGISSYTLDGSALDNAMRFNDLADGRYTFEIKAYEQAYCPDGGYQTLESLWSSEFTVGEGCVHSYHREVVAEPGCEDDGLARFICTDCGDVYEETVPALGHSYIDLIVAPGCEEGGYTDHTCSRCGDGYRDGYTDPTGHSFENGVCISCGVADENAVLSGDLDGDGAVTSADAVLLARYLVDLAELTDNQFRAADVDRDGAVTSADAVMVARYLVGVIDQL